MSGKEYKLDYKKVIRSLVNRGQLFWLRNNLFAHLMWYIILAISNQRELNLYLSHVLFVNDKQPLSLFWATMQITFRM